MPRLTAWLAGSLVACALAGAACAPLALAGRPRPDPVVATNLRNPRGLFVDVDGALLVAEAGLADAAGARDRRTRDSATGRVSRIAATGGRSRVLLDGLPSQYLGVLDEVIGTVALARDGQGDLLVLTGQCASERCSSLLAVDATGSMRTVADLHRFARSRPAEDPFGGLNEESNPWGLALAPDGAVYVTDAAANSLLRVDRGPSGAKVSLVARLDGDPVPTAVARASDGALYVALLSHLPHTPGTGAVVRVTPDGVVERAIEGLTMPIGLVFESDRTLLVLELAGSYDPRAGYGRGSGRLLRVPIDRPSARSVLREGLDLPTGLASAANGQIFVGLRGAFTGQGRPDVGRVIRLSV